MIISFLLHFYQPYNQQQDILDRIVNESYRPLIQGLLARPRAKLVINITGALLSLLDRMGYADVLDGIKKLHQRGQVELTGSAMYHAFLPLLPQDEIVRQIDLNEQATRKHLAIRNGMSGFFSPEMAVSDSIFKIISKQGHKWIAAPSLAASDTVPSSELLYKDAKTGLNIMFRNKRVSSLILSSVIRDAASLIKETQDLHTQDKYWFCVMDAETFGHHRIGHEKVLFDILEDSFFEPATASDILEMDLDVEDVSIRPCTWTNTEQDFYVEGRNSFMLWKDPTNPIHKMQWEFTKEAVSEVSNYKNKDDSAYKRARKLLDRALSSDQYWWASVKPWWSLEMIEQGAYELLGIIEALYRHSEKSNKMHPKVAKAHEKYSAIMAKAFYWQRSGYIRKKHLENSATYMKKPFVERTPAEWYNQIILEFEDEMKKAAKNQDFEKAIKWRDALLKLTQRTDIYDVLHVVDELWSARQIPELKPFLDHDWKEFSEFAKSNFKDVESKKEFEEWKKTKKKDSK